MLKKYILAPILLTLFFCAACAKIGKVSGGPKDEDPPKVVECSPANNTLNFDYKKFEVVFDEYVKLKNVNNELIISPPLKEKPNVWLKGKSLMVEIENELDENTTYTFNFGNAIVDNNEGNILEAYEYVFSTGDYLDSLSISGVVLKAFDFNPEDEAVFVMLYDSICDSVPYLKIPKYIGKTDKKGHYTINNIKDSVYKVFALKDANSNLLFDNPTEAIAFLDTNIQLTSQYFHQRSNNKEDSSCNVSDTISLLQSVDTILVDSVMTDSLEIVSNKTLYQLTIDLFSFEEYHEKQYITNTSRVDKRFLLLSLNLPVDSVFKIEPVYYKLDPWCVYEYKTNKDTLICWLTDTAMINCDTLNMAITTISEDTLGNPTSKTDTINFRFKEKKKSKSKKSDEEELIHPETLELTANIKKGAILDLNNTVSFQSNYPILNIIKDSIKLYKFVDDTVLTPVRFSIQKDTVNSRLFSISHSWEEETPYMLLLCPQAVSGMYNLTNDSIPMRFSTQVLTAYGTIILKTINIKSPVILLLMNSKEDKVFRTLYLDHDQTIHFKYLKPGDYFLKIIFDDNDNKKWDTGNYLEKLQPEAVTYFEERIDVRSNWDIEQEWEVQDNQKRIKGVSNDLKE